MFVPDQTVLEHELDERDLPGATPSLGLEKTAESDEERRGTSSDSFADPLRIPSDAKEDGEIVLEAEDRQTGLKDGMEYTSTEKDSSMPHPKRTSHLHLNLKPPSPQPWELVEPPTTYSAAPQKPRGFQGMVLESPCVLSSTNPYRADGPTKFRSTRPSIPKSSYYFGPPPLDAAFGTPPVGQIGVHHPREIIRIERDYTGGELTQFTPIYPLELEGRVRVIICFRSSLLKRLGLLGIVDPDAFP